MQHITEDNTVRNTVIGLTLPDSPVDFVQTSTFDPKTGLCQHIFIVGTSVTVRHGDEHLVDRGPPAARPKLRHLPRSATRVR